MFSFAKNDLLTIMIYDLANLTRLDEMQLKLLLILASKADPARHYTCDPTQEELSQISGWSRPTVQNVINSLLELRVDGKRMVTSQKVPKQGGGYCTIYSMHCFN